MKYAVIYESATGNTEMLAKEIKSTLGKEKCVCFGTPEEELQSKAEDADLIFLGFWTDKGELESIWRHCITGMYFSLVRQALADQNSILHRS